MIIRDFVKEEIQLNAGECCIVFNFGCYFPYSNTEVLTFEFSLGMKKFEDYKINHRYPNKCYQTISKKYKRKVSKIGYPYIFGLNEQNPMLLKFKIGFKDQCITSIFPIQTEMTKDKPICGLSMFYNFEEGRFHFFTYEKNEDGGWKRHNWYNYEISELTECDTLLSPPDIIEDSFMIIYHDIITPKPSHLSELFL